MLIGGIALLSALLSALLCLVNGGFESLNWLWLLPCGFVGSFLGLAVLVFLLLWFLCAIVDLNKPQEKDSPFYRWMVGLVTRAAMPILRMRVHTQGLEKTPKSGRFLLVCNHLNDLDPVVLMEYFKDKQLAFISKRENSAMFIVGKIMHKILCQRINRENDREALKTILNCIRIIKEDKASIAVFPEGGIKGGNVLHPFRSGVFKIALRTKVPVVVCTLWGTQDVFHNGLRLKPTDVQFHVLGVVQPEVYKDMTAVDLGHLVHDMMAKDLGPDRVLFVEEKP